MRRYREGKAAMEEGFGRISRLFCERETMPCPEKKLPVRRRIRLITGAIVPSVHHWVFCLAHLVRNEYRTNMAFDRIRVDPNVCGGKPTVRSLRITVDFVLKLLGDGYTAEQIVQEYPELEIDDVYQAAKYGAWLASERTTAV